MEDGDDMAEQVVTNSNQKGRKKDKGTERTRCIGKNRSRPPILLIQYPFQKLDEEIALNQLYVSDL